MKNRKLSSLAPPGADVKKELKWTVIAITASALRSLFFIRRYLQGYRYSMQCYEYSVTYDVLFAEQMPPFGRLISGLFTGFWMVIIGMVILGVFHWRMHFGASRSIYLLRRLPDRKELIRRTIGMPLLGTVIDMAAAVILLLIYYLIYRYVTPAVLLL